MSGFNALYYYGEPIEDVEAWALDRGEKIISYSATREVPNMVTGRMTTERRNGTMPESFWNALMMTDGWIYKQTGERDPLGKGDTKCAGSQKTNA